MPLLPVGVLECVYLPLRPSVFSAFGRDNENIGSVGGCFAEYANLLGDPSAISNPGAAEWFNTKAFAKIHF
jgi:hypothetical protein